MWWLDKEESLMIDDNIILGKWLRISHKIGSGMGYWVLTVSGKVVALTTIYHVIHSNLLDPYMKGWIEKFDEELEKQLDGTKFVDDVRANLYIDHVDESNEEAHVD